MHIWSALRYRQTACVRCTLAGMDLHPHPKSPMHPNTGQTVTVTLPTLAFSTFIYLLFALRHLFVGHARTASCLNLDPKPTPTTRPPLGGL